MDLSELNRVIHCEAADGIVTLAFACPSQRVLQDSILEKPGENL